MQNSFEEPLDRELILAQLTQSARGWLRDLQVHAQIDSTNTHLLRQASSGIDGVACLAEHQTHGRGRRGRSWLDRPGRGLAMSLGRRMQRPLAELAPVSLVAGVAVAKALQGVNIRGVTLKWPNDILVDGAKAGGILVEVAGAIEPQIVIGVGLNIGAQAELEARLGHAVGDVLRGDVRMSRNALAAAIIDSLTRYAGRFDVEGFAPLRSEWEALHAHQDRRVRIRAADGEILGIARGVAATGELRLQTDSGLIHCNSGEVSLRDE
jgi:BirA family transcriptional regulator, biotin operon repressor / biotin---[acetyl-CoA-carboxylase] ligase